MLGPVYLYKMIDFPAVGWHCLPLCRRWLDG